LPAEAYTRQFAQRSKVLKITPCHPYLYGSFGRFRTTWLASLECSYRAKNSARNLVKMRYKAAKLSRFMTKLVTTILIIPIEGFSNLMSRASKIAVIQ
jgi:hypothetical protein